MSTPDVELAVVGAGIAGLAAAAEAVRAGRSVAVFEASGRAGGSAWSEAREGYLTERGANTCRIGPAAAEFLRRHALEDGLVAAAPVARERFLLRGGRLVAVPTGPRTFARSPLLSRQGKLRLLREPFEPSGDPTGESVAEFARRRLGREAADALIGPFLTGVYAGDETRLGAEAVFPSLVAAERRSGSIARGLLAQALERGRARGRPGSWSTREGMGGLPRALAARLGDALRLHSRVSAIAFETGAHRLEIEAESGPATLRARSLVLACPAREVAALVEVHDKEAARALRSIGYAPVASVSIGVDPGALRVAPRGFGFLVPRGESDALLGCLYPSQLFAGRAPAGRELLTLLAGGTRRPYVLEWADDALVAALLRELDRVLGLTGEPTRLGVARWPRAVPQPGRDHPRLVADLRARLARVPRLALAGAYLDGVAFGDAMASGAQAARALLEER